VKYYPEKVRRRESTILIRILKSGNILKLEISCDTVYLIDCLLIKPKSPKLFLKFIDICDQYYEYKLFKIRK